MPVGEPLYAPLQFKLISCHHLLNNLILQQNQKQTRCLYPCLA